MSSDYINTWIDTLRKEKTVFAKEVLDYLKGDVISLDDDHGQSLNLRILSREPVVDDELGQEIRLQFLVEAESLAKSGLPFPILWHTFNSELSLEENQRNLHDFVISHYRTAATMPTILPKRPS